MKVGIAGVTGYAGEELYRILKEHPEVEISAIMSKSFAGKKICDVYANYIGDNTVLQDLDTTGGDCDLVFTALPHGLSMNVVTKLLENGKKVIDLSGDFRYNQVEVYEKWYGTKHEQPHLLRQKVYGLPEVYRQDIKCTSLVANPGCYTTTSILALRPLIAGGLIDANNIIIDAKSGVSGAGRTEKLPFSFCEVHESFKAYGVATHRHTSEIEQELSVACGEDIMLSFTPHLIPAKRGIFATIYANVCDGVSGADIQKAYEVYKDEPFTHVLKEGSLPELKHVVLSNNCAIGFVFDERMKRVVIASCTDNLLKGAAGQAVQNMNIMFGFEEKTGLSTVGTYL